MFKTFLQTAVQSWRRDGISQYTRDGMDEVIVAVKKTIQTSALTSSTWEEKYTGGGAQNATSNMKTCTTLKSILLDTQRHTYIVCVK